MNNDHEKHYDCDPADCAGYRTDKKSEYAAETAQEFGAETPNEFDTESAQEFSDVPNEYSDEHAKEFGMANGVNDVFNAPGILAPFGYPSSKPCAHDSSKTDLTELYGDEDKYDFETSAELSDVDPARPNKQGGVCKNDGCGCGIDGDFISPDHIGENGADNDFSTDPNDETAATTDYEHVRCGCNACGETQSAREKCALDDYEIISDVLGSEKELVKLYSTALCESAEEQLRDIIRGNLLECADDQYKTFEFMEKRGLYPTEQATEEKITQAKQQFTPLCDHN